MFHLTLAQYMFAKALGAYIEGTTNASLHAELAEDLKWVLVATIDRVLEIYSQGIIRPGFVTMQVEWADDTPGV